MKKKPNGVGFLRVGHAWSLHHFKISGPQPATGVALTKLVWAWASEVNRSAEQITAEMARLSVQIAHGTWLNCKYANGDSTGSSHAHSVHVACWSNLLGLDSFTMTRPVFADL